LSGTTMRILIIGCGSIGSRHIRNLISMGYKNLVVYDADEKVKKAVAAQFGITACNSVARALDETDMALVCTPADSHVRLALLALKKNNAAFIEKPLSASMNGVTKLRKYAGRRVSVGFNVRFHPMVLAIKNLIGTMGKIYSAHMEYAYFLPGARKGYLAGYAGKKAKGGGVILDHLHEIDYGISLFGRVRSVFGTAQKISDLDIQTEDTADIVLRFKKGFVCSLHLDYLQRAYSRSVKIVAANGVIEGDFASGILKVAKYGSKARTSRFPKGFDETYKRELRHFIGCLHKRTKPAIDVEEAVHSLQVALAIKRSVAQERVVEL
jgi:predicted dehydrogenase